MSRARDSQRSAVYAWEKRLGLVQTRNLNPLSLEKCQEIVDRCYSAFRVGGRLRSPTVRPRPGAGRGCYRYSTHQILLPEWTRQTYYVVHEAAHAVTMGAVANSRQLAGHGPEFVRVYCEMLVGLYHWAPSKLLAELTAGKRNVRIAGVNDLPWRVMRKARMAA